MSSAAARDVVAEVIAYNAALLDDAHRVTADDGRDLTAEALRRKLEALASTPFRFFRGTFHLMARDLLQARVPGAKAAAPDALIVGDLHLENFGVYRGASGALCFDVNDFDDVGLGPVDLDLKRLCTSAFLLPGLGHGPRLAAAKAIARAWADGLERIGGRFPLPAYASDKAEKPVADLLHEKDCKTQGELIAKVAPEKGHGRFGGALLPDKGARVGKAWQALVEKAGQEYGDSLRQLKADRPGAWKLLDVIYRFKGTGSLGRLRFQLLVDHDDGRDDARLVLEIKEARPSVLDDLRGHVPAQRARVQTAAIRRLQGDPWPRVAGTHLGRTSALGRELQPAEQKLDSAVFAAGQGDADHARLLSYAGQCGEVLARMHARASAHLLLDADWKPQEAARAAVEFAERYAAQVEADQKLFVQRRADIAKALRLA